MAQEPLFHPLQREKPLVVWLAMWSGEGNWAFGVGGPDFQLTLLIKPPSNTSPPQTHTLLLADKPNMANP